MQVFASFTQIKIYELHMEHTGITAGQKWREEQAGEAQDSLEFSVFLWDLLTE